MNFLRKIEAPEITVNQELLRDTLDLFSNRRAGHMGKWMYSYPLFEGDPVRGAELWAKVIENAKNGSPYYVFNDERTLIQKASPQIASYLTQNYSLIDLGPGSRDAFTGKIEPIIKAGIHAREYIGVDISTSILDDIERQVQQSYPFISAKTVNTDFFEAAFKYPSAQPAELSVLFGLTLFNLCIDPRIAGLPEQLLSSYLNRLASHFRTENGLLVITQDTNQDPEALAKAYETNRTYQCTLLHRIARDLPIDGNYDPNGFELVMEFHPDTKAYSMSFQATKPMRFSIDGELFNVEKNERFYFHNCFKFSAEQFIDITRQSKLDHVEMITDGTTSVLHVLIPR